VIVVDMNVIAYLLIDGEHTAASETLLEVDPAWAAPLLWRSEWRNVLAGYIRRGELDRAATLERIAAAEQLLGGREYLPDSARVMELVDSSTCSAYDCEYVALADALGVPLVTNDRQVLRDFRRRAVTPETYVSPS